MQITKKVSMPLVGIDGNPFAIIGVFSLNARRQGWTQEEIKLVIDEATTGDYNHLLATFASHVEEPEMDDDDECDDMDWDEDLEDIE